PEGSEKDSGQRMTESQRTYEAPLAAIKATEGETADALKRARAAEARAVDALRAAQEERQRARREREAAVREAREEAERLVGGVRDEVTAVRRTLERETVTAPALDQAAARLEERLERLPAPAAVVEKAETPPPAHVWLLGE